LLKANPSTQKPYDPSSLNVAVDGTVLWINSDNTAHTVTEGNPSGNRPSNGFDSGILSPGQTFKHAFDKPGTVSYYCTLHPFMLGQVIKAMAWIIHVQNAQDMIRLELFENQGFKIYLRGQDEIKQINKLDGIFI
jgi:plastocyanin